LRLSDFDYRLPKELIAQYPCAARDSSRLLVLERAKGRIMHQRFADIVNYLSAGDVLVLNDTKVIYARIIGKREEVRPGLGGGKQEIFLLENLAKDTYRVLAKPARKLTVGAKILFNEGDAFATVIAEDGMSKVVKFCGNGGGHPACPAGKVAGRQDFWRKVGRIPLPPYIKREPQELDKERYQTVYAREEGACAAPTAGLHFTRELLKAIQEKGVNIVYLTLHINYGTFAPVKCEDISKHQMHKEYFILSPEAAEVIKTSRARGKKVFAVGTTSVRVLETCADTNGLSSPSLKASSGWTDLFIYPPYTFKTVDCLLTNFHFPKSTLLMLVGAFGGRELILKAYQEAMGRQYRFFSYGDAMLIL